MSDTDGRKKTVNSGGMKPPVRASKKNTNGGDLVETLMSVGVLDEEWTDNLRDKSTGRDATFDD